MNLGFTYLLCLLIINIAMPYLNASSESFLEEQKKYIRVRNALAEKEPILMKMFADKDVSYPPQNIFIRVFKLEKQLELWARSKESDKFKLIKVYDVCYASGGLGPKRKEGDQQVPEGFYHIDRFNPASMFHLSLGLNYPNDSDRVLSNRTTPGGDIFIHGNCVSIGCVAITDEKIKELYVAAIAAKTAGQKRIPVHIFPTRMEAKKLSFIKTGLRSDKALMRFWANLKEGYDHFETIRKLKNISVSADGAYGYDK